ncbi:MAG: fasciclin domain-containing protein [Chitinophagaceae bacterium]
MKIRQLIKKTIISIAISGCLFIAGCGKEEDTVPVINNTVAELILKGAEFNTLEALLARANLALTLEGTGPFTVFAPDDSAFAKSGVTVSYINSLTQQEAQVILLYHTLNSKVLVANLPVGPNSTITTFSGDSLFITKNSNGIYINGAKISQSDITADNGIIHKIEGVLIPPAGTIAQTIYVTGLDSLAKAIARATNDTTGSPALANVLNSSTITMFAPTDSAFTNLLSDLSLTDINEIPVDTLVNILNYHLVPGLIFSPGLNDGLLTMLEGGNTSINLTNGVNGGPTITGNGNGANASNITMLNIVSRYAVVHLIDRALIP